MIQRGRVSFAIFLMLISLFAVSFVSAADFTHVVSNSDDWRDVYSTIHYANLNKVSSNFLVSPKHGSILTNELSTENDVQIISSSDSAFVINYEGLLEDAGFEDVEELELDRPNIELIETEDLENIKDFIVVGADYGYNAIAVAPYAVKTNAWVFLVDRTNIDEVDSILGNREVDSLIIYGFIERDIKETLEEYDPEIIDEGDRFKDNIEIVKKFIGNEDIEQVLLTNGEFIEGEVMSGAQPVLFTGKENVPDQISDYIQNSDISVGVLVGSDLVGAATNIRRTTGISVIVKFARGARIPGGAVSAVEGLDLFYLPIPTVQLDLHAAKYNRANSQLELTYKSESDIPIFFRGTITPNDGDVGRLGDVEPIFIAPEDFKTVSYPDVSFDNEDLTLDIFTVYGDSPLSLEKILQGTIEVQFVDVIDGCQISIESIKYSKSKDAFIIEVENLGTTDCWVDIELEDVLIDGVERTLGSEGSERVRSGKTENIVIEQEMSDEDLEENPFITVVAYHGEREDSLVKITRGRFELKVEFISAATITLAFLGLIVLFALIFLILFWRRRKKEDPYDF